MRITNEIRCPFCDALCGTIEGGENMPAMAYVSIADQMVKAHLRKVHPDVRSQDET